MEKKQITQKDSVITFSLAFLSMMILGFCATTLVPKGNNLNIYISYLIPQVSYLLAIIFYSRYAKFDFKLNIKQNAKKHSVKYIIALFLGAGLFFSALLLNYLLQKLYVVLDFDIQITVPSLNTPIDYLFSFILICIIPPVCEELMFRKTLSDGFSTLGAINAALLSGAIFSLSHLNPAQTIYQFILGFILALIYIRTKDILITIIVHIVNNLLAFFLTALTNPQIWIQFRVLLLCFLIALPITVLGLYLILKGGKVNNKKEEKIGTLTIGVLATLGVLWLIIAIFS